MLGDCWFLSVAGALAEYPDRIKKLFVNTQISKEGVYWIKLFKKGMQDDVSVDDQLLVLWKSQLLHSDTSNNGAYWVPILEKAVAKFFVNYGNLDGGSTVWAFRFMTNMPV